MKKRLHYAMPRIPLHKLKMSAKNVDEARDVPNKPETHVGTIAKIIWNAKLGKRQAPKTNAVKHGMVPQNVAKIGEKTVKRGNMQIDKHNRTQLQNFMKTVQEMDVRGHVGLSKKEKKQMRKMMSKLQKIYRSTYLQTTTSSSDTSESFHAEGSESSSQRESGGSGSECVADEGMYKDEDMLCMILSSPRCEVAANGHNESCVGDIGGAASWDEDNTSELDEVNKVEVVADVHDNRATDQNEEAVGGMEEELESDGSRTDLLLDEETELCEVSRPGYGLQYDSSFEDHCHDKPKAEKRWKIGKNKGRNLLEMAKVRKDTVLQVEGEDTINFQWGQEESSDSESDGGWDFEIGGMPLLPR